MISLCLYVLMASLLLDFLTYNVLNSLRMSNVRVYKHQQLNELKSSADIYYAVK